MNMCKNQQERELQKPFAQALTTIFPKCLEVCKPYLRFPNPCDEAAVTPCWNEDVPFTRQSLGMITLVLPRCLAIHLWRRSSRPCGTLSGCLMSSIRKVLWIWSPSSASFAPPRTLLLRLVCCGDILGTTVLVMFMPLRWWPFCLVVAIILVVQ